MPSIFPMLSNDLLNSMLRMNYLQRATEIISLFLDDFFKFEVREIIEKAYDESKFDDSRIAPLRSLDSNTYSLELFHGPTSAFKDMALQVLPHLLKTSSIKNNENNTIDILVATSGDTGKAALEGFKNIKGVTCTVFYPKDGVSEVQKLQMCTTDAKNTNVIAVDGNFDDTQNGVKNIFNNELFKEELKQKNHVLSSANSINFGRLVPQIVYYISSYLDLVNMNKIELGEAVNYCVPTGNFGNILAAYYARCMGLPINKLICASNSNNVLSEFINSGVYDIKRDFHCTISPSMDILISSNLERLLYELCDRNTAQINEWMDDLKNNLKFEISKEELNLLNTIFFGDFADEIETKSEIKRVFKKYNYLMDTHTAVASQVLNVYRKQTNDNTPTVIVSTANAYKFPKAVLESLLDKETVENLSDFECAEKLHELTQNTIPKGISNLQSLQIKHDKECKKQEMQEAFLSTIK